MTSANDLPSIRPVATRWCRSGRASLASDARYRMHKSVVPFAW